MNFIHIADVHLGAKPDASYPWGVHREREIYESFYSVIDICNDKKIDLLLIAGDFFNKQPLLKELKEVNYALGKLEHTKVVLMAGNHDYISVRSNYTNFSWNDNVHMLYDSQMNSVYIEELNTQIYGFSYHTRDIIEPRYDYVTIDDKERINILLGHGGTIKDVPMNMSLVRGNGFDYVALGHIHIPQIIQNRIAYSGSLEPMDKTEIGSRGYIYGQIYKEGKESQIHLEFVPNSKRQYIDVTLEVNPNTTNGSLVDMAKAKIEEQGKENIYIFNIVGYKDPDIIFWTKELTSLGNVIEVVDSTVPNYDFDTIYNDNYDNIIGYYIKNINESPSDERIREKALYLGMEALLKARNS